MVVVGIAGWRGDSGMMVVDIAVLSTGGGMAIAGIVAEAPDRLDRQRWAGRRGPTTPARRPRLPLSARKRLFPWIQWARCRTRDTFTSVYR